MTLYKHMQQLGAFALSLAMLAGPAAAIELQGVKNAHDPGSIIKDGDTYFNFTTGPGIWYSTSKDLVTWSAVADARVFKTTPQWVLNKVQGFTAFWAPEAIHMNGFYYMYYSVSTMYTSRSAIGVARSPSLKTPAWTDLGIVAESFGGVAEINAIDPALFRDHDGKVYMSYGSFHGGIGVAEINQSTGKFAGSVTRILGGNELDVEAPYITRNGDFYYLFINRGKCCDNAKSTYYVEAQRASSVTGPYTGTRTVLPMETGKYRGPGHVGVLKQDGCNFASIHYYDLQDAGNAKLDILRLTYSGDWPVLSRNFTNFNGCGGVSDGTYALKSRISGKVLSALGGATGNGTTVVQANDVNQTHQSWYVIGKGDGTYSTINVKSLRSLDNFENSTKAGTRIAIWDYWGGPGQRWRFASPTAGYHVVTNVLSGMALDMLGSQVDNNPIIQYNLNNNGNQQFQLLRR